MHRTVSVAVLAGVLLITGLGGVASSSAAPELAPSPWESPPEQWDEAEPEHSPRPPTATATAGSGRERVGTVEQVDTVLGYLTADRSATFSYPGADYVKVHLRRLLLLPGDYLTVSDPAGDEVYRYDAAPPLGLGSLLGSGAVGDSEERWAMSITGDTAVVTLHQTRPDPLRLRAGLARFGVTIDKVARGFLPAEAPDPGATGRQESVCGINDSRDAVCYRTSKPAIYRNSKAVARLLINGIELCTAFRVGPDNRLMTNHHCLDSTRDAQRTEVWFNYQCAECGGWAVFRPTKVRGDRVLDTHRVLDYTLFTVANFAAVERYGYLELSDQQAATGVEIYIPQHPRGLPAQIAVRSDRDRGGSCQVAHPQAHGYGRYTDVAYYCDTDGGSSGSPVLSRDSHQVIALHHFGGCPNGGVRMDLIYPRIAPLL